MTKNPWTTDKEPKNESSPLRVFIGITFVLVWLGGAALFGMGSLFANLMANDSDKMSSLSHGILIFGFLAGVGLQAIAGIYFGMAISDKHKWWKCLKKFGLFFIGGCAIQLSLLIFLL